MINSLIGKIEINYASIDPYTNIGINTKHNQQIPSQLPIMIRRSPLMMAAKLPDINYSELPSLSYKENDVKIR